MLPRRHVPALLAVALLALGAVAHAGPGRVPPRNKQIFPPQSAPYGKTYGEWSAAWWRWASSIPAAGNPVVDQTGANAAVGQSGPVWFLAGNLGGSTVRTLNVPAGTSLFVPLFNTAYLGFPCDARDLPGCEIDQALEQANDVTTLVSFISPFMDGVTLACEIDGVPVQNLAAYRVRSSAHYALTLPDENIFGLPAGPYHPCVDTGYYLMLSPLKSGQHTLRFAAATADESFALDVTYHLTVLPELVVGAGN